MNVASTCAHERILYYYNDIHFFSFFNTFFIIIIILLGLFSVLGVFFIFMLGLKITCRVFQVTYSGSSAATGYSAVVAVQT